MSNIPVDLQGTSRYNILGFNDGYIEYQERLHTLMKHNHEGSDDYIGHCCDQPHGAFDVNNSECEGY